MHIYTILDISAISGYQTKGPTFVTSSQKYSEENSPHTIEDKDDLWLLDPRTSSIKTTLHHNWSPK